MTECSLRRVPAAGSAVASSDFSQCQQTSRGDPPSSRLGKPHLPFLPSWQLAPGLPALPLLPHSLHCPLHGTPALWTQHQRVSITLCIPLRLCLHLHYRQTIMLTTTCWHAWMSIDADHNMQAAQCNPNQQIAYVCSAQLHIAIKLQLRVMSHARGLCYCSITLHHIRQTFQLLAMGYQGDFSTFHRRLMIVGLTIRAVPIDLPPSAAVHQLPS